MYFLAVTDQWCIVDEEIGDEATVVVSSKGELFAVYWNMKRH